MRRGRSRREQRGELALARALNRRSDRRILRARVGAANDANPGGAS